MEFYSQQTLLHLNYTLDIEFKGTVLHCRKQCRTSNLTINTYFTGNLKQTLLPSLHSPGDNVVSHTLRVQVSPVEHSSSKNG